MTLLVACFNCGFLLQLLFKAAEWKSLPLMAASLAEGRQEHAALIVYLMVHIHFWKVILTVITQTVCNFPLSSKNVQVMKVFMENFQVPK